MEYMEPCCIGRELPQMLTQGGTPVLPFQTQGNVTLTDMLKGLSSHAGNALSITLAVPVITLPMLRVLAWYHRRGWLKDLTILTRQEQTDLITPELQGIPHEALANSEMGEGTLVIRGELKTVIIQGDIIGEVVPRQCKQYTACISSNPTLLANFLDTLTLQLRNARRAEAEAEAAVQEPEAPVSGDSSPEDEPTDAQASSSKPRRKRKA